MAKRLQTNIEGSFYVNDRCIDCDTCRQLAPETFAPVQGYSAVVCQPQTDEARKSANHALLACPVAAIVSKTKEGLVSDMRDFPLQLDHNVYYCGYTSEKSYGGSSYFIKHPEGNWLVDAPRFVPSLAKRLEELGGVRYIFLTHRDDVADASKYAEHFSAERIIHRFELAAMPNAEIIIDDIEPLEWRSGFRFLPSPGHTKGHMLLLYNDNYLFTGDHLAWSVRRQALTAFKDYCWYSWPEQLKSLGSLLDERFEWVLPGHGARMQLPFIEMKQALHSLLKSYE